MKTSNWKAPGPDKIQNYWWKKLTSTHQYLVNEFNKIIEKPQEIPTFLTEGNTYLIPKDPNNTKDPAKYRPITCLPTIYKILTSCISEKIYQHTTENHIIAEQQKGCARNTKGCKEQLVIDSTILGQIKNHNRNLNIAYIDYQKAFDSMPHSWLIYVLKLYKIHPTLVNFLENIMQTWKTTLILTTDTQVTYVRNIAIKRGIFQGDTLSALWFTIAINPLSALLEATKYGFQFKDQRKTVHTLSHLFYMDDLKIYASNETQMKHMLNIVHKFSENIHMKFGLDKCKTINIKRGKITNEKEIIFPGIENMTVEERYKYLGIKQSIRIDHTEIKNNITQEFQKRLKMILKTELNGRNTIKAINTFAIPILTYTYGVIKWSDTDHEHLQRIIRTNLTRYGAHHPNSNTERMILPRNEGGRGIIDIKTLYNKQLSTLRDYFYKKESHLHRVTVNADKNYTPLNLSNREMNLKIETKEELIRKWAEKSIHGRHYREITENYVDTHASNKWLDRSDLFRETEAFLIAIQDRVLSCRNYQKFILKTPNVKDECRRCNAKGETIEHIISGCKTMAEKEYLTRHNNVAKVIHQQLAHQTRLIENKMPNFKYIPNPVLESAQYKLTWDRSILTDKETPANRPDIVLIDRTKKRTYIIDIAIPNAHNLRKSYNEKISKYTPLKEEIKRMWNQQEVKIVPITISATGVIPVALFESLSALELPRHIYSQIQKETILATCHLTRKFLS